MRIFAITPCLPDTERQVRAVGIVAHELISGLRAQGHEVTLQVIEGAFAPDWRPEAVDRLAKEGVAILPKLHTGGPLQPRRWSTKRWPLSALSMRATNPAIGHWYPGFQLRTAVARRIQEAAADVIVPIWCPDGIAATHGVTVPRVAYHGDIEPLVAQARAEEHVLFSQASATPPRTSTLIGGFRQRAVLDDYRRSHHALMAGLDSIANVTAWNAEYYAKLGHPRSFYLPNTWPRPRRTIDTAEPSARERLRIIGHAGHLSGTGSAFGLRFLVKELLPSLERHLPGSFEIHVIGALEPPPVLKEWLADPRIVVRGFVDDLDREIATADAYLLLNNAGPYVAGYTRHVVAWSLGACLAVHTRSALAIPEVEPGVNAIAGGNGTELASRIAEALVDPGRTARIRQAGRKTYEDHFTPRIVSQRLGAELERVVSTRG